MPPLLRRLLPPLLSAVLALAVAVPATWYLASGQASGGDPGPSPVPTGPTEPDGLRAMLLAQLPDPDADGAVLLEVAPDLETGTGLAPGRYRVQLICGLLRQQGAEVAEVSFYLGTPQESWRVVLPCPSHPLTMAEELDFTGAAAGAVSITPEYRDDRPSSHLLLLRFVPVTSR